MDSTNNKVDEGPVKSASQECEYPKLVQAENDSSNKSLRGKKFGSRAATKILVNSPRLIMIIDDDDSDAEEEAAEEVEAAKDDLNESMKTLLKENNKSRTEPLPIESLIVEKDINIGESSRNILTTLTIGNEEELTENAKNDGVVPEKPDDDAKNVMGEDDTRIEFSKESNTGESNTDKSFGRRTSM